MSILRDLFLLDPSVTFLNHGSFGATPKPVFEAYQRWQAELERQPVEFLGRRAPDLLRKSRAVLADYLGTQADNLVYVTNATTGLNVVARGLKLGPGDEILATDHEYGALDRTWRFLSRKQGFSYKNQPVRLPLTSSEAFVEQFWQGVTPRTRAIFISHITSPTALIFPVDEICRRARQTGILTIVDGAHAPGQIPLALDALGADFYSGNLHKWLCAPKGSAFLFARPAVQHLIEPLIVSWGWESDTPGPSPFVDILEWTGTRDIAAFLAVPEAIRFQAAHDWDTIRGRCHALVSATQQRITDLTGIPPLHPDSPRWFAQMGTSVLPLGTDITAVKNQLYDRFRIEVPLVSWQGKPLIRYSFQAYNSSADADSLLSALHDLIGNHAS